MNKNIKNSSKVIALTLAAVSAIGVGSMVLSNIKEAKALRILGGLGVIKPGKPISNGLSFQGIPGNSSLVNNKAFNVPFKNKTVGTQTPNTSNKSTQTVNTTSIGTQTSSSVSVKTQTNTTSDKATQTSGVVKLLVEKFNANSTEIKSNNAKSTQTSTKVDKSTQTPIKADKETQTPYKSTLNLIVGTDGKGNKTITQNDTSNTKATQTTSSNNQSLKSAQTTGKDDKKFFPEYEGLKAKLNTLEKRAEDRRLENSKNLDIRK